mmetsp:Transcript_4991/g.6503  ORF Transcript_4991/g.6503 Transcript_4991/m.6503 type:complete len:397 (+) Transcript_4991:157-1347(+)
MVAKIAVIGAGWWGQGWHIPAIHQNPNAELVAIVDPSSHPQSTLTNTLESLETLKDKYKTKIFSSVSEMLNDVGEDLDGVIVSTPHSTHYHIGSLIYRYQDEQQSPRNDVHKPIHILMEKPMTTEIGHALKLCDLVQKHDRSNFWINHSANFRAQALLAKQNMPKIGTLLHVSSSFASPVMWVFEEPKNTGWNVPTGTMQGNGFAWGQQSHLLAWIYFVCGVDDLKPLKVFCNMNHTPKTGADISHSACISCVNNVVFNLSGTALLPGSEYAHVRIGKQVRIQIYGSKGAILYEGDDEFPDSGKLEYRAADGSTEVLHDSFQFENATTEGCGPESVANFVQMCCSGSNGGTKKGGVSGTNEIYNCADARVGLRTVQTLEAMYRSHASQSLVDIRDT